MARSVTSAGTNGVMAVNYKDMQSALNDALQFRTMHVNDLTNVIAIEQDAYTHPWTLGIFRDCIRVGYKCWVVEMDNKIIGYGVVMMVASESHILNICIHPDYQGSGYGRALLGFLIEQSQQFGADMVLLEVRESNKTAIALYHSSNFHELGVRRDYYPADKGREHAIILAKYLDLSKD